MNDTSTVRRRNAADSRQRLLEAAGHLFAERGYDRTTVRDIGKHAEVDPTMIARYFGGKAALYLETLRQDTNPPNLPDLATSQGFQRLLDRYAARGATPTLYSAVRAHEDPDLQTAAVAVLTERIVQPLERRARSAEHDDSQLRAEIVTAALAGIVLARSSRTLPALADAPSSEIARLVGQVLDQLF